jgi:hypothetical protein
MPSHGQRSSTFENLAQRFWRGVRFSNGCWPWKGEQRDYHRDIYIDGKKEGVHRVAFYITRGYWPNNACHKCDNPCCARPSHIFDGTHQDNMADKMTKGRHRVVSGEEHYTAKLTTQQVYAIKRACAQGKSYASVGRKYGMSSSYIGRIVRGEKRRDG